MHEQHHAIRAEVPLNFVVGETFLTGQRVRLDRIAGGGSLRIDGRGPGGSRFVHTIAEIWR